jgi:hypothetical protein
MFPIQCWWQICRWLGKGKNKSRSSCSSNLGKKRPQDLEWVGWLGCFLFILSSSLQGSWTILCSLSQRKNKPRWKGDNLSVSSKNQDSGQQIHRQNGWELKGGVLRKVGCWWGCDFPLIAARKRYFRLRRIREGKGSPEDPGALYPLEGLCALPWGNPLWDSVAEQILLRSPRRPQWGCTMWPGRGSAVQERFGVLAENGSYRMKLLPEQKREGIEEASWANHIPWPIPHFCLDTVIIWGHSLPLCTLRSMYLSWVSAVTWPFILKIYI